MQSLRIVQRDRRSRSSSLTGSSARDIASGDRIGHPARPTPKSSLSVNLSRHAYDGVRTVNLTPPGALPARYGNGLNGPVYGAEIWGDLDVTDDWRLSAGLTLLESDLEPDPLAIDINGSGLDPGYQVFLRSHTRLAEDWTLSFDLRAIDEVSPEIPAYVEPGARLAGRLGDVVLALNGQNLLDESHPEFLDGAPPPLEARRSVQLSAIVAC